jgi:hypothetical protein
MVSIADFCSDLSDRFPMIYCQKLPKPLVEHRNLQENTLNTQEQVAPATLLVSEATSSVAEPLVVPYTV